MPLMINSDDSNSETNSRLFQGGLVANGESEAVNPIYTVMVTDRLIQEPN